MFFNKVVLLGNATKDAERMYLPGNEYAVAKFGIAVNQVRKEKKDTLFIDCSVFGKLGEIAEQYIKKGLPVLIEGRLKYSTWSKDGYRFSKHEVIVDNFQVVGFKKKDGVPADEQAPVVNQEVEDDIPF